MLIIKKGHIRMFRNIAPTQIEIKANDFLFFFFFELGFVLKYSAYDS